MHTSTMLQPPLPPDARHMLATSLKQVCLYDPVQPDILITVQPLVEKVMAGVIDHFPGDNDKMKGELQAQRLALWSNRKLACGYRNVTPAESLARYDACFERPWS